MIRLPEEFDDATLHAMTEASCCTACSREVLVGDGIQWVDQMGRVHRHCPRCHGELMNAQDLVEGELAAATVQEVFP